jgi:uncharacterized protein YuzE
VCRSSTKEEEEEENKMQILYNAKTDLLYLRLDDRKQQVINKRLSEDTVLGLGEDDRVVGIEILDPSKYLKLERLFACGVRTGVKQDGYGR